MPRLVVSNSDGTMFPGLVVHGQGYVTDQNLVVHRARCRVIREATREEHVESCLEHGCEEANIIPADRPGVRYWVVETE